MPPPIIAASGRPQRQFFCRVTASGGTRVSRSLGRSGIVLNRGGCCLARGRLPSRTRSTPRSPSSLDSIVLASGAGLRKLGGCPGYSAPLAAALKRAVPSDSAPAIVSTRWPRRVRDRSGANSLLDCANNERSPSKPHSPVNHAVHAGGCRRHDRLGHRGRTDRRPAAGASARITEMTSGCRRGASRRLPLAARLVIETMHSARPFHFAVGCLCRRGCDEEVRFRDKPENIYSLRGLPVLTDAVEKVSAKELWN